MNYCAYILFSTTLGKYYIGYTSDMDKRLVHHNSSQNKFTKKGVPWVLIKTFPCEDKTSAMALEKKIKSRGTKRYLQDLGL